MKKYYISLICCFVIHIIIWICIAIFGKGDMKAYEGGILLLIETYIILFIPENHMINYVKKKYPKVHYELFSNRYFVNSFRFVEYVCTTDNIELKKIFRLHIANCWINGFIAIIMYFNIF